MDSKSFISHLKENGARVTPVRKALVELFASQPHPLDYASIQHHLGHHGLSVNKTTVYRELEFLLSHHFIVEVEFGEGKKRYELAGHHHHHAVCTNCNAITAVHIPDDLSQEESRLLATHGFRVTRHLLEFFGLCAQCQKKGLLV